MATPGAIPGPGLMGGASQVGKPLTYGRGGFATSPACIRAQLERLCDRENKLEGKGGGACNG